MDDDIQSLSMAIFRVGRAVRVSGSNVFQQRRRARRALLNEKCASSKTLLFKPSCSSCLGNCSMRCSTSCIHAVVRGEKLL